METTLSRARPPFPKKLINQRQLEYWPIGKLKPGPKVRVHPEAQIERICASIRKFGFVSLPLISKTGEIITGVARIEAARREGYLEVPVLVAEELSAAELKAYRVADNKLAELSVWDEDVLKSEFEAILELDAFFDLQSTGFDTAEIDLVLVASPAPAVDDAPVAVQQETVSRLGDDWWLGPHRLVCDDALSPETVPRLLGSTAARLVLTDPPYNVGIVGHAGGLGKTQHREFVQASGEMSAEQFDNFLKIAATNLASGLMDGGVAGIFMDWRSVETVLRIGRELGLRLINIIVWNKTNAGMGSLYRSKHELLCLFKKGKAAHINNVQLGAKGRYRTNVWDYAGVNTFGASRMADLKAHPTVKPVAMIADAILDLTDRGDLVLDTFAGSGTTIIAAQNTGRIARCLELDPAYVDVAIRRFEARFKIKAVHQQTGLSFAELAAERSKPVELAPLNPTPRVASRPRPQLFNTEVAK